MAIGVRLRHATDLVMTSQLCVTRTGCNCNYFHANVSRGVFALTSASRFALINDAFSRQLSFGVGAVALSDS